MTNGERSFKERLEVRIAFRKIESAFDACHKLAEADKQPLYEEIGKRLLQYLPHGPTEVAHAPHDAAEIGVPANEAPHRFRDRCLELADVAPTDDIREILLGIADLCEETPEAMEDPSSPAPR